MSIIFTFPFFISLYYVAKNRHDLAFLNVYLPCLLLLSTDFAFRIPHLPPVTAASWAALPIAGSLLLHPRTKTRPRLMDLWVLFFWVSLGASEVLREQSPKDGFIFFLAYLVQTLPPYIIGRLLIEPNLRLETAKKIVILMLAMIPAVLFEARMGRNVWLILGPYLGAQSGSFEQLREGHARVQACFGHAIIAGVVVLITILLNCWLLDLYKRDPTRLGPLLGKLEHYKIPACLLILFLLLTRSRGPMSSTVLAYAILQISRFKNIKIGAVVVFSILALGGLGVYAYMDKYTSGTNTAEMSEEQASATYRREMLKNYAPVIQEGGWLGWGAISRPVVAGQFSIDNHYLLTQITQGKFGLYAFMMMVADSILTCLRHAFTFRAHENQLFAFVMLGCLLGLFVALTTVWLGQQSAPVCFFLLGWGQSLQERTLTPIKREVAAENKYQFKRVFV